VTDSKTCGFCDECNAKLDQMQSLLERFDAWLDEELERLSKLRGHLGKQPLGQK